MLIGIQDLLFRSTKKFGRLKRSSVPGTRQRDPQMIEMLRGARIHQCFPSRRVYRRKIPGHRSHPEMRHKREPFNSREVMHIRRPQPPWPAGFGGRELTRLSVIQAIHISASLCRSKANDPATRPVVKSLHQRSSLLR